MSGGASGAFTITTPPFINGGEIYCYNENSQPVAVTISSLSLNGPVAVPNIPPSLSNFNVIFSGDGLTVTDAAGQPVVNNGSPLNCPTCALLAGGQPVNYATGEMWHQMTDFNVPGRTPATSLLWQRTYLEAPVLSGGDFGPHWIDNWETQLIAQTSSATTNLFWIDPTGGAWTFTRNPDNSFTSPPGYVGTLTEFSDHYTLTQKQGITLTFSRNSSVAPIGRLTSLAEPHGESVSLTYSNGYLSSISTGLAGSVTIARDSQNRVIGLTRVRDSLSYAFTYNASGSLATASDFANNTYQFGYLSQPSNPNINGLLASITDPIQRVWTFNYDSIGRMSWQTEPGNATRSFSYSTSSAGLPVTTVTEIDGSVSVYQFDAQYRLIQTTHPDGSIATQQWNAQNQVASTTDELNFTTFYGYDARNNLSSIQKPMDPSPTTIAYNQSFDVPTLITPLVGAPTQMTVDPNVGNITRISRASSSQTLSLILGYDPFGNVLSRNNGLATYSDQTNANGLRTLVFDARNPETRAYDSHGRVATRTFASGRILTYTYDNYDEITRIDDTAGPSILNQFDVVHRVTSRTVQSQDGTIVEQTQYTWDARDRLTLIVDALGNKTQRYFDQTLPGGSIRIIDQPTRIVDANGHETDFVFDSRLRLVTKTDANEGITQFGYNFRSDLTSVTDADKNLTAFAFDGNRRLTQRSRASLAKDKDGKEVPALEVSIYGYDLAGKLLSRKDVSVRDAQGGRALAWSYDSFDRMVEKIESKTLSGKTTIQDDSTYSYQPQMDVQRLATANNENELLSFQSESVPPFAMTSYSVKAADAKNPLGLIQDSYTITPAVTAPIGVLSSSLEGTLLSETYDPAGRLSQLVGTLEKQKLTSTISFDGLMRRRSIVDASTGQGSGSLVGSFSYDLLNRLSSVYWDGPRDDLFSGHFSENLTYDSTGNITLNARELGNLSYSYDPTNQLLSAALKDQGHHDWDVYSPIVNRSWKFDLTGNRLNDSLLGAGDFIANGIVSDKVDNFTSDPDGFGNVVGIQSRDGGLTEKLGYRADGKMTSFEAGWDHSWFFGSVDKFKTRYFFDALGRRIAKLHGYVDESDHRNCDLKNNLHHHDHYLTLSYSYLGAQDKILLAKDAGGEVSLYLDGQGIDDHLGEIRHGRARGYVKDHQSSIMNSAASGGVALLGAFGEMVGFKPHTCARFGARALRLRRAAVGPRVWPLLHARSHV